MLPITLEFLMTATGATRADAERFLPFIQRTCETYHITTPARVAGFLSQIGHESGGLAKLQESLNYSVEALLKLFGRHRISEADARRYGRAPGQSANQEMLANLLYGGEFGRKNLGNTEPGDGWRFRGRGLKQLTGRSNYRLCGEAIGVNLVSSPERLLEPELATRSAGWFWHSNGLNELADRGDVAAMTKRINGGAIGLAQRETLYRTALARAAAPVPVPGRLA
jgi:putative chitinase